MRFGGLTTFKGMRAKQQKKMSNLRGEGRSWLPDALCVCLKGQQLQRGELEGDLAHQTGQGSAQAEAGSAC